MRQEPMPLSRLLGAACTLVFGGVSAAIGWRAGHLLAQAPAAGELPLGLSDGDLLGAAGVAAVAFSAVLLNLAVRVWKAGASLRALLGACLWLLLAFYAAGNAVKFSAYHRAETTSARILAADRYDDGREQLRAARQKLNELKSHPSYSSTAGCTKIAGREIKTLCAKIAQSEEAVRAAQQSKASGRPAAADPGSQSLAWVTGLPEAWIVQFWPVFVALVFELSNCLGAFAVSNPRAARRSGRQRPAAKQRVLGNMDASNFQAGRLRARSGTGRRQLRAVKRCSFT